MLKLTLFTLQLWIWGEGRVIRLPNLSCEDALSCALLDTDSLLRQAGRRDTFEMDFQDSGECIIINQLPQRVRIRALDTMGWVYGIYWLLTEKHGFCFVHSRVTVKNCLTPFWQNLEVCPKFKWRGFHLHTQHPIELTEALHNPRYPEGERQVKEYIDWLVRNGQNYFEFCLLRSVDLEEWIPYFRRIVSYARKRGVAVGLDLSLRMQQQRAFQLLPRKLGASKSKQLRKYLTLLSSTQIARLNIDITSAEFVGKDWGGWIDTLLFYAKRLGVAVMSRQHVVPPQAYAIGDFTASDLPRDITLCVHSVMCYSLQDTFAPVYRCKDFSHLYRTIKRERKHRKVWYYPETAYWVTFDNSVPVWLLSYLRARLEDIQVVEGLVEGHLTFSSGWDMGYWIFDWSVARWMWRLRYDENEAQNSPQEGFIRLFGGDSAGWAYLIRFQDSLMVGRNLLSYITPTTPIDEIGWRFLPPFQPRLPAAPWRIYRKPRLYYSMFASVLDGMRKALSFWPRWPSVPVNPEVLPLWEELKNAWEITELRVAFRYHWLSALVSERFSEKEQKHIDSLYICLQKAESKVHKMPIRYPSMHEGRLCRKGYRGCVHPYPTYRFGYLYPAVSLHFWKREIGQVEEGRWGALYKNLWDIPRIIGLYP
ncbi:MAG: hypothetical protein RMJ66_04855 [Bacteroidia bacterium]|nr:GNAT family N-acetyltransferase [Bacteroidia bacterium]MDW8134377.1 hypothetical protein [Bacteroidia bacterium]